MWLNAITDAGWPCFWICLVLTAATGCSSTLSKLHVPADALTVVEPTDRIEAVANVSGTIATFSRIKNASSGTGGVWPEKGQNWVNMGWTVFNCDSLPEDVAQAVKSSNLFAGGSRDSADLDVTVRARIADVGGAGDQALNMLVFFCTLGLYAPLGGPFPAATGASMDIEIAPVSKTAAARVYHGESGQRCWASMYSYARRATDGAQQSLAEALQVAVKKAVADRQVLAEMASESRRQRALAVSAAQEAQASVRTAAAAPADPVVPPPQWPPVNTAVAELTSSSLSANEPATLTEVLRGVLVDTKYFNIVSRSDMGTILKEQSFQKSAACDDTACLVEMGKLLAVQKIIGGMVGKVGSTYSLSLRLVDVETGRIETGVTVDVKGDPDVLLDAIRSGARQLAAKYAQSRK